MLINKKKETGSGYFGHASMMSEESFNEIWKQDVNSKATISSFPDNGNKKLGSSGTVWEGMKDGGQKEPIGYWCGNRCAQNVSILDVQAYKIHLFKDDYKRPATDEEYSAAVKYAEDQIGKPYLNYLIPFSMWATDSFYCSSLVFRSWYEVDQKNHLFNLRMNPIYVSPGDIYTSKSSVFVESYSNF